MISSLRFGWINTAHSAIQEEATGLLPQSGLQNFLQKNAFRVDYFSQREDEEFSRKGPPHFLYLERLWQEGFEQRGRFDRMPFFKVRRAFDAQARKRLGERLVAEPLTPERLDALGAAGQANVYQSVVDHYQAMVQTFAEIRQRQDQLKRNQKMEGEDRYRLTYRLTELAGQLSHFVADLYQPMHDTYYDWEIPAPARSAHFAIDGLLYSDSRHRQDFTAWRDQFHRSRATRRFEPEALSLPEIKRLLAGGLEACYMKVFDLVQADARARSESRRFLIFGINKAKYLEKLRAAWSPIIQQQMNQAAEMTAALLHSAYVAGGAPNLGALEG